MKERDWTLSPAVILAAILTSNRLAPVVRWRIPRLFVTGAGSIVFSLQTKRSGVRMELSRDRLLKVISLWLFRSISECDCCVHIRTIESNQKGRASLFWNKVSNQFLFPEEPLGLERVGWTKVFSVILKHASLPFRSKRIHLLLLCLSDHLKSTATQHNKYFFHCTFICWQHLLNTAAVMKICYDES